MKPTPRKKPVKGPAPKGSTPDYSLGRLPKPSPSDPKVPLPPPPAKPKVPAGPPVPVKTPHPLRGKKK